MPEFLVLESTTYSQDAWVEESDPKDAQARPIKLTRSARSEQVMTMRIDRSYTATVRVDAKLGGIVQRQAAIAACKKAKLGGEIAPGVTVVEYEHRFIPMQPGNYSPEAKDKDGNRTAAESYSAPTAEKEEHVFTLRAGADLIKLSLSHEEFAGDWKTILTRRLPNRATFAGNL